VSPYALSPYRDLQHWRQIISAFTPCFEGRNLRSKVHELVLMLKREKFSLCLIGVLRLALSMSRKK
jgi:hypothetical protein